MEAYALVEADFQQYYQLNLIELLNNGWRYKAGFLRYARLFSCLPPDSRIMRKLNPAGAWSWDDEVQSRILNELSQVKVAIYNTNRGKGKKALKPDKQFQPDHVENAKKEYAEWQKQQKVNDSSNAAMESFWKARNPDVQYL